MKKIILFILFISIISQLYSKVHVVGNLHYIHGAKYRSVQSAIEAADEGDTIYVRSSPINYGNIIIDKQLVLIGEGLGGKNISGKTTKLTRVTLGHNPMLKTSASGTKIIGFEFAYFPSGTPNIITTSVWGGGLNDIEIRNNWIWYLELHGNTSGWKFINNVILETLSNTGNTKEHLFSNNFLNDINGIEVSNFNHNFIAGSLMNNTSLLLQNNILTNEKPIDEGNRNITSRNNFLRYNPKGIYLQEVDMINNIISNTTEWIGPFPEYDFIGGNALKLKTGSKLLNAGYDGEDIGIFGGGYKFPVEIFIKIIDENSMKSFWEILN